MSDTMEARCMACGGPVDAKGKYAHGGEVDKAEGGEGPPSVKGRNDQDAFDSFAKALLKRGIRGL